MRSFRLRWKLRSLWELGLWRWRRIRAEKSLSFFFDERTGEVLGEWKVKSPSQQSVTTVPYAKPTLQSKLFALGRRRTIGEYRGRRTDAFDRDTQKMETDTEVGLRGYKDEDGGGNQEESGMMMTNVEKNRGWGKLYFFLREESFIWEREKWKVRSNFFVLGAMGNILEEAGKW